jgi:hypothetical protein
MPITFVHLSDIHFGQEEGSEIVIHDDVKDRLIEDAAAVAAKAANGRADGVIVSGDIAYAGKSHEYTQAGAWLDRLTAAVGCERTAVQVVPGNHDIDRDGISSGCQMMLDAIIAEGEAKLDAFLESQLDRECLYGRFEFYRPFAEGYDCPLDRSGGIASDRHYDLGHDRTLRIIGLNSALICSVKDKKGRLLLGARQRVLPRRAGEEIVVLCHHPLHWLQDSDDARRYVRNRARVFVPGHEHNPSLHIDHIKEGCDLMVLAAGATVPPRAENGFTYTYNVLTFDLEPETNGLRVSIVPRAWSEENKDFVADNDRLGGREPTTVLGCPNFHPAGPHAAVPGAVAPHTPAATVKTAPAEAHPGGGENMDDKFPLLLLRFFRDLTPGQRLAVLVKLRALPDDWRDQLTHAVERSVVDGLARAGRLGELEAALNEIQGQSASQ